MRAPQSGNLGRADKVDGDGANNSRRDFGRLYKTNRYSKEFSIILISIVYEKTLFILLF